MAPFLLRAVPMGTQMDTESHECEDFDSDGGPMDGAASVGEAGRRSASQLFSAQGKRTHPLEDTGSGDPGRQKVADRTVPECKISLVRMGISRVV